jgi:hypothetical protein
LERQPKKILEIGTWVGSTAYAMAYATEEFDTIIYTCDAQNAFLYSQELVAKRIQVFPNTWSSQLLDYGILDGMEFIFNDAELSDEDAEKIYNLASDEFYFVTHDYFDPGPHNFPKGEYAISTMVKMLKNKKAKYELHLPRKEWFPSYLVMSPYRGINGCCAFLKCKK